MTLGVLNGIKQGIRKFRSEIGNFSAMRIKHILGL